MLSVKKDITGCIKEVKVIMVNYQIRDLRDIKKIICYCWNRDKWFANEINMED